MEESVLKTIKDMLGISDTDKAFDTDLIVNINAIFSTLFQLGIGKKTHYFILDSTTKWDDLFEKEKDLIDFIKLYTYMKVKVIFDPPTNSSVLQAFNEQIKEIEYRILLQADPSDYFDTGYDRCDHDTLSDPDIEDMWKEIMD